MFCGNVRPITSGGWTLPTTHFASINHIITLRIINLILIATDFYLLLWTVPFTHLRPGEVCSLNDPWSFAASNSPMHFINRSNWKSSQHYILTTVVMASSMHEHFASTKCLRLYFIKVIVLAPSSVCFSSTAIYLSLCSFVHLCVPCYCHAYAQVYCVCVWRSYWTQFSEDAVTSHKVLRASPWPNLQPKFGHGEE